MPDQDPFLIKPRFRAPLNNDAAGAKTALVRLRRHDPRTVAILGPATLAGFTPVSGREYDRLRRAARLVGAP